MDSMDVLHTPHGLEYLLTQPVKTLANGMKFLKQLVGGICTKHIGSPFNASFQFNLDPASRNYHRTALQSLTAVMKTR